MKELLSKIEKNDAKIGIIGMGYVGLPLAIAFCGKGFEVLGFDIDQKKVDKLLKGETYIHHIPDESFKKYVNKKLFATSDFSRISEVDAIIICVPTPLDEHREPDMSFVLNTALEIQKYLKKGQIVSLESTTYPGTTSELLLPLFEEAPGKQKGTDERFTVGEDFCLAFSPEREDPNNPTYNTSNIPKVVGGETETCTEIAGKLYSKVIEKTVPVSSTKAAEATKLLENIYRSVNIALVNELKVIFDKMDIDIWEVINAASTKPFGYHPFFPGPGLGGHCIPIDPFYLTWKAREYDFNTRFIELAGEINTSMPYYVVSRTMEALNSHKKSINGSKILILGAAYKKNIDDMRESPSLKLIEIYREKGAEVDYSDPYVPKLPKTRKYNFEMKAVDLTEENIKNYDVLVVSTDHDNFDYELIHKHSKLIVDTRNAFERINIDSGKYFKA